MKASIHPAHKRPMQDGDTLLEIVLALWLIGIAALGSLRLQLWAERAQRAALWHTHAAHLADSAAEALRSGAVLSSVAIEGNAQAAARLPNGGLRIVDQGLEARLIIVHWDEAKPWSNADRPDTKDCPQSGIQAHAITRCLFITVSP